MEAPNPANGVLADALRLRHGAAAPMRRGLRSCMLGGLDDLLNLTCGVGHHAPTAESDLSNGNGTSIQKSPLPSMEHCLAAGELLSDAPSGRIAESSTNGSCTEGNASGRNNPNAPTVRAEPVGRELQSTSGQKLRWLNDYQLPSGRLPHLHDTTGALQRLGRTISWKRYSQSLRFAVESCKQTYIERHSIDPTFLTY